MKKIFASIAFIDCNNFKNGNISVLQQILIFEYNILLICNFNDF